MQNLHMVERRFRDVVAILIFAMLVFVTCTSLEKEEEKNTAYQAQTEGATQVDDAPTVEDIFIYGDTLLY